MHQICKRRAKVLHSFFFVILTRELVAFCALFARSFIFKAVNQNIFVISGLGADHTVFEKLVLPGYTFVHIAWVQPAKQDTMSTYAKKLLPQITEENPIVLGLSLGGMLALEVGKHIATRKVISLSSSIGKKELPWSYRLAGLCRLQKVLPLHLFAKGNRLTQWFFGVKTPQDRKILNEVFIQLDRVFLYWALNALLTWENHLLIPQFYRIHGTKDLVLPARKTAKYDVVIEGGTHLMLLDKSEEVSEAILKVLEL